MDGEPISDGGGGPFSPLGDVGSGPVSNKDVKQTWVREAKPIVVQRRPSP